MKRFDGKVAIMTGAGSVGPGWGNGRATAVRLAEEGAKILAVDRDLDRLAETLERAGEFRASIRVAQCDVTDAKSVAAMVAEAAKAFGRIDVLVNNVGGSAADGPVEMSEEVFDTQVDYNLKSVFLTCKHVLPIMEEQRAGAIVNVSSTSALRWTGSAQVAYAATSRSFCAIAWGASRSDSWATAATPPRRCSFSPRTKPASSPARKSSSTAA